MDRCVCGRDTCDLLNRNFHRMMAESGLDKILGRGGPRYRYYEVKGKGRKPTMTYEWTTQTAEEGKYWTVERKWVKGRGSIVRKMGFKQRNKAKARAYEWYQKAQPKAVTAV